MLNDRIIMSAKSEKKLSERVVPVVAMIVKSCGKKAQLDKARWRHIDKDYTKMITETIKGIKKNLEDVDTYVLKAKPDETQTNRSILSSDERGIVEKLDDYRGALKNYEQTVNELKKSSGVLLKTDLDRKMWGSKKVMNVISRIKSEMEVLSEDSETIDSCLEQSDNEAYKIQATIKNNYATSNLRKVAGKVVENFAVLKSFSSELAQVLHPLSDIDRVFKASVGYPATWFVNGSTFMDFQYEYENLVDHMTKFATLESNVVEPLLVWKIKTNGSEK